MSLPSRMRNPKLAQSSVLEGGGGKEVEEAMMDEILDAVFVAWS